MVSVRHTIYVIPVLPYSVYRNFDVFKDSPKVQSRKVTAAILFQGENQKIKESPHCRWWSVKLVFSIP